MLITPNDPGYHGTKEEIYHTHIPERTLYGITCINALPPFGPIGQISIIEVDTSPKLSIFH